MVRRKVREAVLKVNLGCGDKRMAGYVDVDCRAEVRPDVVSSVQNYLKTLPDSSVDEVIAHHILEHLGPGECEVLVAEIHRVLKPGGKLIVECPDFARAIQRYSKGQIAWWQLKQVVYGGPAGADAGLGHRWGWGLKEMESLLVKVGFNPVVSETPQAHGPEKVERDFRLVATR